jgi:hypothetical protein
MVGSGCVSFINFTLPPNGDTLFLLTNTLISVKGLLSKVCFIKLTAFKFDAFMPQLFMENQLWIIAPLSAPPEVNDYISGG